MKTLYLMYKASSRFFLKELFLILQMVIVIVLLNSAITPFINYRRLERVVFDGLPENSLFYSAPLEVHGIFDNKSPDYLSVFESNEDVAAICKTYRVSSNRINGEYANVILYNSAVFEELAPLLKSGEWRYDTDGVYVNSALEKLLGNGTASIELALNYEDFQNGNTIKLKRRVIGVINAHDVVYDFSGPSVEGMGTDFEYERNINPEHPKLLALVPYDFENGEVKPIAACAVLKLQDGVEPEEFAGRYSKNDLNGDLTLKPDLRAYDIKRLVGIYRLDLMLGILLLLSSVFGIGGYTYLKTKLLQKQMGIYTICGCKKSMYRSIVLLTNAIIVAVSVALAFVFKDFVDSEGYDTTASIIIAASVAACVYLVPVIMTLHSAARLSFSKLLYYGD